MSQLYGVVNGVYYCGMERTEQLSQRMAERNIPSATLQPQFSIRPVSTKYDMMPIFDRRPKAKVPIKREPTYSVGTTFNPGSAQAPWSGFASNINKESQLRNQFFRITKMRTAKLRAKHDKRHVPGPSIWPPRSTAISRTLYGA